MDKIVAVGFGCAVVTCDGEMILDGEDKKRKKYLRFRDAERLARKKPRSDWRVVLDGPLHGETYQRHGKDLWCLVKKNQGFA